jgi:hypothetical protein
MSSTCAQLDDLGARVENHKRPTPTPALATRTYDSIDAPARSLAHLQLCAKGLRSAIDGEYSRGIKMARMPMENAMADFKATIARVQEASKWKRGVADSWYDKGEEVCGDLVEEAAEALKTSEAREFISMDSESGNYKGPTGRGAAPSQWRSAAEELGDEDKEAEASKAGPEGPVKGERQRMADIRWPIRQLPAV